MKITVPKETHAGETRVAMTPESVEKLVKLGADVEIESSLGESLQIGDEEYKKAGASVAKDRRRLLSLADMVLRLRKPPMEEIGLLKKGCIHLSYLDPFNEPDLIKRLVAAHVSAISMEMIPRTTRAQKMDALTSQANLAGYAAVVMAAERIDRIFPMMTTPAGTIAPSRVFVIGAGVAGLQAIATAKRLGAVVEAFDTRPVVEEQIQSLGARFVKVEMGETGQTAQGYARALTDEQLAKQREVMAKHSAMADVIITTAQIFGRPAPRIITEEILATMKTGSVVVDMAVESGGNVAGSQPDKEIKKNGVTIIGLVNLPGRVARNASRMYASNLANLVEEMWDKKAGRFVLNTEDEIIKGCLVTHNGQVVNEQIKNAMKKGN